MGVPDHSQSGFKGVCGTDLRRPGRDPSTRKFYFKRLSERAALTGPRGPCLRRTSTPARDPSGAGGAGGGLASGGRADPSRRARRLPAPLPPRELGARPGARAAASPRKQDPGGGEARPPKRRGRGRGGGGGPSRRVAGRRGVRPGGVASSPGGGLGPAGEGEGARPGGRGGRRGGGEASAFPWLTWLDGRRRPRLACFPVSKGRARRRRWWQRRRRRRRTPRAEGLAGRAGSSRAPRGAGPAPPLPRPPSFSVAAGAAVVVVVTSAGALRGGGRVAPCTSGPLRGRALPRVHAGAARGGRAGPGPGPLSPHQGRLPSPAHPPDARRTPSEAGPAAKRRGRHRGWVRQPGGPSAGGGSPTGGSGRPPRRRPRPLRPTPCAWKVGSGSRLGASHRGEGR